MIDLLTHKTTKRLNITTMFFVTTFSVLSLAMAVTFFIYYEFSKNQVLNIGSKSLTYVLKDTLGFMDAMNQMVKAGDMKLEVAQEIVRTYLLGPKDQQGLRDITQSKMSTNDYMYVWAMHPDGTMAMHPFNFEKKNLWDAVLDQKYVVRDSWANKSKTGHVFREIWQNPGEPVYTFISAQEYYAPWDWIVGVGQREELLYAKRLESMKYTFLGIILLVFSITCALIFLFSRRLIQKIKKINMALNEAENGTLRQSIHFSVKDEFGVLAETFNSGVSNLQSLYGNQIPFYSIYDESEQYLRMLSESEARLLKMVNLRVISAHEEERKRLARDLHDRIGQALYSVAVAVKLVNRDTSLSEPTQRYIKDVETAMLQAITELKSILNGMRPAALEDSGLLPTIKSYISTFEPKWNIKIVLHDHTRNRRYPAEIEIAVYRVFQEALLNARKYAKSDKVTVYVRDSQNKLEMVIQDFGIGFNAADKHPGKDGFGLYGMKERVLLLNGLFEIDSEAGMGTKIRLSVPLPEDECPKLEGDDR